MAETFADLELQLGQILIDALVSHNLAVIATPWLYHGSAPDDCCPPPNTAPRVVSHWPRIGGAAGRGAVPKHQECGGPIAARIDVRLLVCWPVPGDPIGADIDTFQSTSRYLTDAAWIGTVAYNDLICDRHRQRSMGLSGFWFLNAVPRNPRGGCAGVDFLLNIRSQGF